MIVGRCTRVLLVAGLLVGAGAPAASAETPRLSDVALAGYVDTVAREEDLSAAVLVVRDGRVVVHRGYGLADDARGTPFTADTVVGLASLSKQVTAAAVLRLVDERRVALDDDLAGLLGTRWAVPPDKRGITVHQLLTHTSGLGDHVTGSELEPLDRETALRRILAQDLAFAPGTGTEYSNSGYTLLAAVVEERTRRAYADVVDDELLAPAGVTAVAAWDDPRFAGRPVSTGYANGNSSGPVDELPGPFWSVVGNGDLLGTAADLLTWFRALHGGRVLSPDSTAAVFTAHRLPDATPTGHGYGWEVADDPLTGRTVTHNGGGLTGNTVLAHHPDLGLTVVVLGNRITYRTIGGIPLLVRLPADELAAAIATAVATGATDGRPAATWNALPYLAAAVLVVALVPVVRTVRRRVRRRRAAPR